MKKKYLFYILSFIIFLFSDIVFCQQDAQYTQYMYNTSAINPAYAGTRGGASMVALYRDQWAGIDGAPKTQTFAYNSPLGFNKKIGIGGSIINEKVGGLSETSITLDASYNIQFSYLGSLSFGIKGGVNLLNSDFSELQLFYEDDLLFQSDIDNKVTPVMGVGLYFSSDKYYVGLSAPNILQTSHFDIDNLSANSNSLEVLSKERINYYLITGYVFDLNQNIKFKPAVLAKVVLGAPWQLDTSANFMIKNKVVLGASYRLGAAVSLLTGYNIGHGVYLGLSYDRETTTLGNTNFNSGTFEFVLRFEPKKDRKRFLTPRFF